MTPTTLNGGNVQLYFATVPFTTVFLSGEFDAAATYPVTVTATDGEFTTSSSFDIVVSTRSSATNTAPVSATIVVPPIVVGTELSIPVAQYFDDVDGDALTFSSTPLPAGSANIFCCASDSLLVIFGSVRL